MLGSIPRGPSHRVEKLTVQLRRDADHATRAGVRGGRRGRDGGTTGVRTWESGWEFPPEGKQALTNTDPMSFLVGSIYDL